MRTRLIFWLLIAVVSLGLGFSAIQLTASQPQPSKKVAASAKPLPTNLGLRHRDLIPSREAKLLALQKLVPTGTQSLLKVPTVMRHGDFVWNDDGVKSGEMIIWVDLRRQMISAFRGGHEIGTAVIVYGAEDHTSPEGRFPILHKQRRYHSRAYDAPMPASLFITNDGVALHGSPMSSRRASHGCIGLPVEFAEKLFDASAVGNVVEITRSEQGSNHAAI